VYLLGIVSVGVVFSDKTTAKLRNTHYGAHVSSRRKKVYDKIVGGRFQ
jgi:hypothetical protein